MLSAPLETGASYQVTVARVVNINGLADGGGEAELEIAPEIAEDSTAVDTLMAEPASGDTVVPDTGRVARTRAPRTWWPWLRSPVERSPR